LSQYKIDLAAAAQQACEAAVDEMTVGWISDIVNAIISEMQRETQREISESQLTDAPDFSFSDFLIPLHRHTLDQFTAQAIVVNPRARSLSAFQEWIQKARVLIQEIIQRCKKQKQQEFRSRQSEQ
jgi:thymidylate synthase ThyX